LPNANFIKKKKKKKKEKKGASVFSAFSAFIHFQSAERHFRLLSKQRAGVFALACDMGGCWVAGGRPLYLFLYYLGVSPGLPWAWQGLAMNTERGGI
jgi:hypothetical protein